MGVRISAGRCGSKTVLRVDGWLEDDAADELRRVARTEERPLVLDLTGVRSADARGLQTLLELADEGVELRGHSDHLGLLLARASRVRRPAKNGSGNEKRNEVATGGDDDDQTAKSMNVPD